MAVVFFSSVIICGFELCLRKKVTTPFLRKSNESIALIYLLFVLVILMGGSSQNPDTVVYERIYAMNFFSKDVGFGTIVWLCKKIGITLPILRLLIAITGLLLINNVVRSYLPTCYQIVFYFMYIISPLFLDITQVRNFLGMSLLVSAFPCLAKEGTKYRFKYFLLTILAASIQKTFVVYIPFMLIHKVDREKTIRIMLVLMSILTVALFSNKAMVRYAVQFLISLLGDSDMRVEYYLTQENHLGGYVYWISAFANIFALRYCLKEQRHLAVNSVDEVHRLSKLVYWLNIYCVFYLPLLLITIDFFRIHRNLQLLNYLVILMTVSMESLYPQKCKKAKHNLWIATFGILLWSSYWLFIRDGEISSIIRPIMSFNWIVG